MIRALPQEAALLAGEELSSLYYRLRLGAAPYLVDDVLRRDGCVETRSEKRPLRVTRVAQYHLTVHLHGIQSKTIPLSTCIRHNGTSTLRQRKGRAPGRDRVRGGVSRDRGGLGVGGVQGWGGGGSRVGVGGRGGSWNRGDWGQGGG